MSDEELSPAVGSDNDGGSDDGEEKKSKKKKKGGEKKEKKAKKKKADGPKRPQSAYMCYANAERPNLKAANPELTFGELGRKLGAQWGELTAEEKKPYDELAAKDKQRYEDEGGVTKAKGRKRKQEGPKKALSAYMFFAQEWRPKLAEENPDASFGELGKLVGAKWQELTLEEKKPYTKKNKEDKERYTQELEDWEKEHGPLPKKTKAKKPKKKKAKKASDDDGDDDGGDADDGDD